jgi:hypothetical protein
MKQEEIEARLFDLMDQKAFNDLNEEEKQFVLSQMSEEEYSFQQTLMEDTAELNYPDPTPLPLFSQKTTVVWYKRPIPLYQVLSGAAILVLIFSLFLKNETGGKLPTNQTAQNDAEPVIQKIYDTIIREVPVFTSSIKVIHDTVDRLQSVFTPSPTNRLINVPREFNSIPLQEVIASNQPPSFKEDKTASLLSSNQQSEKLSGK